MRGSRRTVFKRGSAGYSTYGGESKRVNLNTESGNVLLLEFTSQVTLDEGGLSGWTLAMGRFVDEAGVGQIFFFVSVFVDNGGAREGEGSR